MVLNVLVLFLIFLLSLSAFYSTSFVYVFRLIRADPGAYHHAGLHLQQPGHHHGDGPDRVGSVQRHRGGRRGLYVGRADPAEPQNASGPAEPEQGQEHSRKTGPRGEDAQPFHVGARTAGHRRVYQRRDHGPFGGSVGRGVWCHAEGVRRVRGAIPSIGGGCHEEWQFDGDCPV